MNNKVNFFKKNNDKAIKDIISITDFVWKKKSEYYEKEMNKPLKIERYIK